MTSKTPWCCTGHVSECPLCPEYGTRVIDPCPGHPTDDGNAERIRVAQLHARRAHPDYEYATTHGPRKQWDDPDRPPAGENCDPDHTWESNVDAGQPGMGWERFEYHEEAYWRRPKTRSGPREADGNTSILEGADVTDQPDAPAYPRFTYRPVTPEMEQLRAELAVAHTELAQWAAADSADAAAGSYALRAERAEQERNEARQRATDAYGQRDRLRQRIAALAERWQLPGHISMPDAAAEIAEALDREKWAPAPDPLTSVRALADRWENALAPDRAYARALRTALDEPAVPPICELPHQTIEEEDACEQQRLDALTDPADLTGYIAPEPAIRCLTVTAEHPEPTPAELREQITTALLTTPTRIPGNQPRPGAPTSHVHGPGHIYDMTCALCRGDAHALADAILTVLHRKLPWLRAGAEDTERFRTGLRWTRATHVDTRTWNGRRDEALDEWLGTNHAGWDGDQLLVQTADQRTVRPEPGWTLARYPDGALIVFSTAAAAHVLEPVEEQQ